MDSLGVCVARELRDATNRISGSIGNMTGSCRIKTAVKSEHCPLSSLRAPLSHLCSVPGNESFIVTHRACEHGAIVVLDLCLGPLRKREREGLVQNQVSALKVTLTRREFRDLFPNTSADDD